MTDPAMAPVQLVLCTTPVHRAADIARALVERRLAACVNVVPSVRSIYTWNEAVCEEEESLLIAKTTGDRAVALREAILSMHPYDVPEVLVLDIDEAAGHEPYLAWVRQCVTVRNH